MKNHQREYSNYNKNRKKKYEDFSNNVEVEVKAPEVIEEDQEIQNDNNRNVKVPIDNLNIRKGPGLSYPRTGNFTGKGVFEIVEIKDGFGKLKSGEGWICLKFCEVLN